uniref:Major facilitator superfamily (MFS) profile domain-containing protein n=1 Tax=Globodera rostochiensis TaxID=31243 RepID=A0A914HYZ8_GLORO
MIALNFTQILMRRTNWENASFPTNSPILVNTSDVHLEEDVLPVLMLNSSHVVPPTVPYSAREKSMLLYAVGLASIVSTFPFSAMYTRFGARLVFFGAGITSAVATALLPLAAAHGMVAFLIVRFFQGFAYGANFAAIGFICHRWASLRQHGLFLSCMTSFTPLSVTITNLAAGFISSTQFLGWPWVFYAHAMVAPLLFGLWLLFYTDFPESHKCVGLRERAVISKGKTSAETAITGFVPYRAILKNKVVLVVWLNSFADIVTIVFITTYMPVYVAKVLRYGVRETGIWSALPGLVQLPLRPVLGIASDRLQCISEMNKMRVFNSVALVGSGLCFALVGFVPENLPLLAVIIMTINTASTAANTGGLYKCGTFVSRQYAHFVVAGIQFEKSVTLFVSPLLFSFFITDESSVVQWRAVFLGMFVILTTASVCCYTRYI